VEPVWREPFGKKARPFTETLCTRYPTVPLLRENVTYIAVAIDQHPTAGRGMATGIELVDDLMLKRASRLDAD